MLDQLAEGIESIRLPCSWILLFAGVALSVYARRRSAIVIGAFVVSVALIAWLRFSSWWFAAPTGLLQFVAGVVIIVLTAVAWRRSAADADAALGAAVGVVASWSWLPCVGPELADILNDAPARPFANLAGTVAFVVGLLLPFVLLAALDVASPRLRELLDRPSVVGAGAALVLAFGVLFATSWSDDLASELFRRSSF